MGFRRKSPKVPRLAQQPENSLYLPPLHGPLENIHTYIYMNRNRKNPAATALLERVKCFLCILLCVVLPAFVGDAAAPFAPATCCVPLWVCTATYATSALVCCCITMLQSQHTNACHVVISVVEACFGFVSLAPLTFASNMCLSVFFGGFSLLREGLGFLLQKTSRTSISVQEFLIHLVLKFFGCIVHILRVFWQVFFHNLSTS